jgi:hypothetical protein
VGFVANLALRESLMLSHSFLDLARQLANKLATVMIASGNPPHFFKISAETSLNWGGYPSSDPKTIKE